MKLELDKAREDAGKVHDACEFPMCSCDPNRNCKTRLAILADLQAKTLEIAAQRAQSEVAECVLYASSQALSKLATELLAAAAALREGR